MKKKHKYAANFKPLAHASVSIRVPRERGIALGHTADLRSEVHDAEKAFEEATCASWKNVLLHCFQPDTLLILR